MAELKDIVIDCERAVPLARFWAQVLDGYAIREYDDAEIVRLGKLGLSPETDPGVAVDGPGPTLFFQEVPEGKVSKNRLHLDVVAPDRAVEVGRLLTLGASLYQVYERWTTLLDPEGNEFCVLDPG